MSSRGKLILELSRKLTNQGNQKQNVAPGPSKPCVSEETDAAEVIKCQILDTGDNISTDKPEKTAEFEIAECCVLI